MPGQGKINHRAEKYARVRQMRTPKRWSAIVVKLFRDGGAVLWAVIKSAPVIYAIPTGEAKDANHSQLVSVGVIYQWNGEKAILRLSVLIVHPEGSASVINNTSLRESSSGARRVAEGTPGKMPRVCLRQFGDETRGGWPSDPAEERKSQFQR